MRNSETFIECKFINKYNLNLDYTFDHKSDVYELKKVSWFLVANMGTAYNDWHGMLEYSRPQSVVFIYNGRSFGRIELKELTVD